ncbi:hypothetical protein Taro_053169 [Colocasia esculenta]|uniref:Uncharacterized protein n=1 Tax=Colocasia esculenta TaxID=4460 RepID=A0A843XKG8_COLES|nr:hypothetical protein [Colocasia esculenta]
MNCAELDLYIEEFDSVILQGNLRLTDVQVEKEREKSFTAWLRYRLEEVHLVRCTLYFCRPRVYADRVRLPADYIGCSGDSVCLPYYAGCPGDRVLLPPSSITCPISFSSSNFISKHRMYMFTRPEDLPRARVVWVSTAQTNFRKSMWEALDKATRITSSQDLIAWMDYGPVWMRRDYWESLCHHWATGPWHERSQATKHNQVAHPGKNVHTSGSVSYATYIKKLETDDKTMADRYVEGTPQQDLDLEAWVDVAGGPRKGRVYNFGDSLDNTPVLSSYESSVVPPAYLSSSTATPDSGGEDIRTLIREELLQ